MQTAQEVLDVEFLEARCSLLDVAAFLDRYDRAQERDGSEAKDDRIERLYEALSLLAARNAASNRAERFLNLFSDP